jgi:hypothetical protein
MEIDTSEGFVPVDGENCGVLGITPTTEELLYQWLGAPEFRGLLRVEIVLPRRDVVESVLAPVVRGRD